MRTRLLPALGLIGLALVCWLGLEFASHGEDARELKLHHTLDSLQHANREHELEIIQLNHEIEDLEDALSDCQEDFQDCLAGRVRYRSGDVRPAINPKY